MVEVDDVVPQPIFVFDTTIPRQCVHCGRDLPVGTTVVAYGPALASNMDNWRRTACKGCHGRRNGGER